MSLHERDYYRDENSSSWSEWLDARGAATIIGITCAIFLFQLFSTPRGIEKKEIVSQEERRKKYPDQREKFDIVQKYSDLYVPAVLSGEVWRFATAFWVHDVSNLIGVVLGMVVVYFTGKMLEPIIGGKEFFAFYWYAGLFVMLGMFLGKLLEKYLFPLQPAWPFESTFASSGSTGPITAVLVLFALKYWDQPIRFFAIAMPAWAAIAIVLSVGLLLSLSHQDRGEILAANGFGILSAWLYHRSGIRIVDRLPRLTRSSSSAGTSFNRESRCGVAPDDRVSRGSRSTMRMPERWYSHADRMPNPFAARISPRSGWVRDKSRPTLKTIAIADHAGMAIAKNRIGWSQYFSAKRTRTAVIGPVLPHVANVDSNGHAG